VANPFTFAAPVTPSQIIDREAEAERLMALALAGQHSRLSAPRRYGKTSLARKVLAAAQDEGLAGVYVDFYGVLSWEDVAIRLEVAYRRSLTGPLARWVRGVLETLQPTVGARGVRVKPRAPSPATDQRALADLVDLPLRVLERTGTRTIVVYDEFQDVLSVAPAIDGFLRSRIESHGDAASYLFAGSHPALMAELFASRARPFYGQTSAVGLPPLDPADLADYVGGRFAETGKDVGDLLEPLLRLAAGHPQRAMVLAHHAWEVTRQRRAGSSERWPDVLEAVWREVRDELQAVWDGLDDAGRRTLAAIAVGGPDWLRGATLQRVGIARSTARDARRRLEREGLLHAGDPPAIVDPLLARWVASGRQGLDGAGEAA
jgi:hypothetical protein